LDKKFEYLELFGLKKIIIKQLIVNFINYVDWNIAYLTFLWCFAFFLVGFTINVCSKIGFIIVVNAMVTKPTHKFSGIWEKVLWKLLRTSTCSDSFIGGIFFFLFVCVQKKTPTPTTNFLSFVQLLVERPCSGRVSINSLLRLKNKTYEIWYLYANLEFRTGFIFHMLKPVLISFDIWK
jgi:hypothetical protein